jgi:hypothetical protein
MQMEQRAIASTKATQNKMTHESGIETPPNEENVKQYLEITLKEIKRKKEKRSGG